MIDARVAGLLLNTFYYAAGTCFISLPLGTLLALLVVKTNMPGRRVFATLLGAMLFVPLYLQTAAWMAGFASQGWFHLGPGVPPLLAGWRGAIWIHAMAATPWVALLVGVSLKSVEPELEEDALLDAAPSTVFRRVTLRRAAGGMIAAAIWVSVWCASDTTVTDLFQIRTFAEEIHLTYYLGGWLPEAPKNESQIPIGEQDSSATFQPDGWADQGGINVASGVLLTAALILLAMILCRRLSPRAIDTQTLGHWKWRLGRGRIVACLITGVAMLLLVGVPIVNLIVKTSATSTPTETGFVRGWSFSELISLTAQAPFRYRSEICWSLFMAFTSATLAVALGLFLAWWALAKTRSEEESNRGWTQPALWVAAICFALPAPMLGIGLIYAVNALGPNTPDWLDYLCDRTIALPVIAQTVRVAPLAILILWHALLTLPRDMLASAESEGARRWRRLLWIALPNRLAALGLAWLVCFAMAFGEFSATALVTPPGIEPLSVRIFSLLHYGMENHVSSICLAIWLGYLLLAWLLGAVISRHNSIRIFR